MCFCQGLGRQSVNFALLVFEEKHFLLPSSGWRRRGARREKRTLFWSIAAMGSSAPTGPATEKGKVGR